MARVLRSLKIPITADIAGLERGLAQVARVFGRTGKQIAEIGKDLTLKITAPLIAMRAAAIKVAADFETSLSKTEGLVGINREQVKAWGDEILALAPKVGKAPGELAEGLLFVTSAGLKGAAAMQVVNTSARASAAGMGETKVIADALTSVLNAYGPANINAADAGDILTNTVREGKAEAEQIAPALGTVINTAAEMGVSFADVGASVALYTRNGKTAGEATTALNSLLLNFLKPSVKVANALASVGTSAAEVRQEIKSRGLLEAMQTLRDRFGDNEEGFARAFGRLEGFNLVLSMTGAAAEENARIFESLRDSTGMLDDANRAAADTYNHKLNQATAAFQALIIRIGNEFLPGATSSMNKLADAIARVSEAFRDLDAEEKDSLVVMAAVAAAIGPVVYAIGTFVGWLGSLVSAAGFVLKVLVGLGAGIVALIGSAGANGFLALLAVVIALKSAWLLNFGYIRTITQAVVSKVSELFDKLIEKMGKAKETVKKLWASVFDEAPEDQVAADWAARMFERGAAAAEVGAAKILMHTGRMIDSLEEMTSAGMGRVAKSAKDAAKESKKALDELSDKGEESSGRLVAAMDAIAQKGFVAASEKVFRAAKMIGDAVTYVSDKVEQMGPRLATAMQTVTSHLSMEDYALLQVAGRISTLIDLKKEMFALEEAKFGESKEQLQNYQQAWAGIATVISDTVGSSFAALFEELDKSGEVLTSMVEGFREFALRMLDMIATQLIAQQAASIALSIAQAPFSFGASLAAIPKILGAVGPALLAIEGAKNVIPGLAAGGRIMRGGMVLVGERGPEMLSLPRGAQVSPLGAGGAVAGGGLSQTLILELDGRTIAQVAVPHLPGAIRWRVPGGGM